MRKLFIVSFLMLIGITAYAQKLTNDKRTEFLRVENRQIDSRDIKPFLLPQAEAMTAAKAQKKASTIAEDEEEEFIFDPEGVEKMYCMTLYSYDMTNQKFVSATSLKSQVRYDADGKTVYFKDLTKSLGVKTWLKGEIDGDTIRIPYGQPLAYYKSKYLVFFVPMIYDDSTGDMEVQDEFKLVVKEDSLLVPTYEEGKFEAAVGYVYVSEKTQGSLSLDLDHRMGLVKKPSIVVPDDIEPVEYVYTYENSRGTITKSKVNVKHKGNDLYMQISTSAPEAYVYGVIEGDSVRIPSEQTITDSTFIYYYSMADAVYENGELTDFVEATNTKKFAWNAEDKSITSSKDVFGVDYMDGMEYCMDYTSDQKLTVYPGDKPAKPMAPSFVSLDAENSKCVYFNVPALDVDSTYINQDLMSYRVYFDDQLYTFKPESYWNLKAEMTDVPYTFSDGYDFYYFGQLHEFYFYETFKKIGIQSVYTVDGIETCSDITSYVVGGEEQEDTTQTHDCDLVITSSRLKNNMVKEMEEVRILVNVKNNGKKTLNGLSFKVSSEECESKTNTPLVLEPGDSVTLCDNFQTFHKVQNSIPIYVSVEPFEDITDEVPENNVDTLYYTVYDETLYRNMVLLEEFTSENCGWCPYGAYRIKEAIDDANLDDEVIWVCHHDGFATDWLTNPVSTELLALYGGNPFAPAWTLNRNVNYSNDEYPVWSIPTEIENIETALNTAINEPCFVDIILTSKCKDDKATITVKAQKNRFFDGQCPTPMISVFIVEDSITPHNQKCYDNHYLLYHNNVLRDVLTPTWGQPFDWNGDEGQLEFTYDIPEEYVAKNLKVVAFIHEYNTDVNQRKVFNVARKMLVDESDGIESLTPALSDGEEVIFNAAGQKVSSMQKGIYIVNGKKILK